MYIVLLKFSENKPNAGMFMQGHNEWLKNGFDENVFLLAGSMQPGLGGVILAHNVSLEALHHRVNQDPFVIEKVVLAEVIEIEPSKADTRLGKF